MQNGNHQPAEYDPKDNSTGCRAIVGILMLIVAAVFTFAGVFVIRLANSPIGSGSGGAIVLIAFLLAGISGIFSLTLLFPRKDKK